MGEGLTMVSITKFITVSLTGHHTRGRFSLLRFDADNLSAQSASVVQQVAQAFCEARRDTEADLALSGREDSRPVKNWSPIVAHAVEQRVITVGIDTHIDV